MVGRRHHRRRGGDPRRHPARRRMRDARDELTRPSGARGRRLVLGPAAPPRPREPDPRAVRDRAGRVRWSTAGPGRPRAAGSTVDATSWDAAEGYEVTSAPSMRMVVSTGRLRRVPLDQPHGRLRAPVQRALHRPDRPLGRGRTLPWVFSSRGGRGRGRGHAHPEAGPGGLSPDGLAAARTRPVVRLDRVPPRRPRRRTAART